MNVPLDITVIIIICAILFVLLISLNIRRLKKTSNLKQIPLCLIPSIVGIFLSIPVIVLVLSILAIFRQFVQVILKIKYKSKFNGLVNAADSLQLRSKGAPHKVNCLIMFQCTKEMSPQVFYDHIKKDVRKICPYEKLNSKFLTYCGYAYMLKEEFDVNDCIREMKTVGDRKSKMSRSEFLSLLSECCDLELPNKNTVRWEIMVGTQKVNWRNDGYDYYPVLYKCDHVIGDGISLMEIMVRIFSDKTSSTVIHQPEKYDHSRQINNFVKIALKGLYMLMSFPAFCISNFIIKAKDHNILRGPTLSEKGFHCLNVNDSSGYVQKVKTIKNAIPGISFSHVIIAAYSASLNDYFIKKSAKSDYISAAIPVLPSSFKLPNIIPEQVHMEDVNTTNRFVSLIMDIPIHVGSESGSIDDLRKRLHIIKEHSDILKDVFESEMFTLAINAMGACFPQKMIEWALTMTVVSTVICSTFPGPPKVYCWNDSAVISDIAGFGPRVYGVGTNATIISFDGRLNIGLNVDKSLIPCEADVREVVDNILKHIDELYKHAVDLKL